MGSGGRPRKWGASSEWHSERVPGPEARWLEKLAKSLGGKWTRNGALILVLRDAMQGGDPVLRALQLQAELQGAREGLAALERIVAGKMRELQAKEAAAVALRNRSRQLAQIVRHHVSGDVLRRLKINQEDGMQHGTEPNPTPDHRTHAKQPPP